MRSIFILIITLLGNLFTFAQTLSPIESQPISAYSSQIQLAPYLKIVEKYLQSRLPDDRENINISGIFKTIGITNITTLEHSDTIYDGSWLSSLKLKTSTDSPGIFKLLDKRTPQLNQPFYAPASTDIAAQVSLELHAIVDLLVNISKHTQQQEDVSDFLQQPIGNSKLIELLKPNNAKIHIAIDFDDKQSLQLGKIQIGRPHLLLRIDGVNSLIERCIQHYIKTRGIPLIRSEEGDQIVYRLPKFVMAAIAGYLPVLSMNKKTNSTSIASSEKFLSSASQTKTMLSNDSQFNRTWQNMPKQSQMKFYISQRLLKSTQAIYTKSLHEKWTDNPKFLANEPLITQLVSELNSPSGLAFSLNSYSDRQEILLKSPFPSLIILSAFIVQN